MKVGYAKLEIVTFDCKSLFYNLLCKCPVTILALFAMVYSDLRLTSSVTLKFCFKVVVVSLVTTSLLSLNLKTALSVHVITLMCT